VEIHRKMNYSNINLDYDEVDDDLPSFEELFSIVPPSKTLTKASKTERTLQHLKQPALGAVRIQADQKKSAAGDNPGKRTGCPLYKEVVR
jgi:hypothetical protein